MCLRACSSLPRQGVESLNRGQIEEAISLFKTALEYEPDSVQILNNIGLAYAKHQDFDGAFEWCSAGDTYSKEELRERGKTNAETLFARDCCPQGTKQRSASTALSNGAPRGGGAPPHLAQACARQPSKAARDSPHC